MLPDLPRGLPSRAFLLIRNTLYFHPPDHSQTGGYDPDTANHVHITFECFHTMEPSLMEIQAEVAYLLIA